MNLLRTIRLTERFGFGYSSPVSKEMRAWRPADDAAAPGRPSAGIAAFFVPWCAQFRRPGRGGRKTCRPTASAASPVRQPRSGCHPLLAESVAAVLPTDALEAIMAASPTQAHLRLVSSHPASTPTTVEQPAERELHIDIYLDDWVRFEGTAAQLIAEGGLLVFSAISDGTKS